MHFLDELIDIASRHAGPEDGPAPSPVPGLTLIRSGTTTAPIGSVYNPSVCIVLSGSKMTTLGAQSFRYDAGKYLIASVDLPARGQIIEAPYLAMAITLNMSDISAMLLATQTGAAEAQTSAPMVVSTLDEELAEAVLRLARLLDHPRDVPALAPLVEREIAYRLLSGDKAALLRRIGLADSRFARMSRAIGWIRQHFDRPLRVETLAELANMSVSSFHRHFKAVTTMSPLQFQKQIRLQEARRLLLAEGSEVASIGFALGYESASQFSREYRRMFGVPPGRDSLQLREAFAVDRTAI